MTHKRKIKKFIPAKAVAGPPPASAVEKPPAAVVPQPPSFAFAVPGELGIPTDPLRLRLDFFHQSTAMTYYEGDTVVTKPVDALDVAHALARELAYGSGLLPPDTLWWKNTRNGPLFAIYAEPMIRKVALQVSEKKQLKRFEIPFPGLVFLCIPGKAPCVYAVQKKPTKETDPVFNAPLLNIFENGRSCGGTHTYPNRAGDMIQSFFLSLFSLAGERKGRSQRFPKDILDLWKFLDGKKSFPKNDLVQIATVKDLMLMETV